MYEDVIYVYLMVEGMIGMIALRTFRTETRQMQAVIKLLSSLGIMLTKNRYLETDKVVSDAMA